MPYYRLCFAEAGRAGCFDEFQAADDAAAMREAELHFDRGFADLWCGERRVARLRGVGSGLAAAPIAMIVPAAQGCGQSGAPAC